MSADEIRKEVSEMISFLKIEMQDEMNEAVPRGNMLSVYLARSSEMLAQAKYYYNKKKNEGAMEVIGRLLKNEKIAASTQKALIDTMCADEQYLVDLIERMNATITHQLDWCRSLVSKNKEEMKLIQMGKEFQ